MRSAGRSFLICAFLLLIFELGIFALSALTAGREVIEITENYHVLINSPLEICLFVIPTLMAFTVAFGALGFVQQWISLPEFLKRACAYTFVFGILAKMAGFYLQAFVIFSAAEFPPAYWLNFAGSLLLALPFFVQLCGLLLAAKADAGGKEMRVPRLYILGSLLLMLLVFARAFWPGWPWRELAVGFSTIYAGAFLWPLAAVLSALGLVAAAVQSQLALTERVKMAGAALYFGGAAVFLFFLQSDLLRERSWELPLSWPTFVGLTLIAAALFINLNGLVSRGSQPTEAATGA